MMRFPAFLLLLLLSFDSKSLFVPSESVTDDEISALQAFKMAVYDDPLSRLSDWNIQNGNPCGWFGISCSDSRVVALNLSNSSLTGFITPQLGSLNSLQKLILSNNSFHGLIPKQLSMLKSLTELDLSFNHLSGPIPPEIGKLTRIVKINIRSNGLIGTLPPELGKLVRLVELWLDRNKLNGDILGSSNLNKSASHTNGTGLCGLHRLEVGDFSNNFFVGNIPLCLKYLPRTSFQGNCLQVEHSVSQRSAQQCSSANSQQVASDTNNSPYEGKKNKKPREPVWLLILEIITGALVVLFLITCTSAAFKRCKAKSSAILPWKRTTDWKDQKTISIDGELLKNVLRISRQELELACEDFSNIIGSYPDSVVYKGTAKDGPEIAVISLSISEDHWTSYLELYFQNEVADLSRLNHENTAKLLGYCKESEPFSRMLVFEYASNGTLYEHLHYGDGCQLSWFRRMKIAVGIAHGLKYLHTELQPPFTMSELTSSAVYLTEDFSPKLVDFERWKIMLPYSRADSGYIINGGPFHGPMISLERRHMDVQGNTFAFGVLLLELISGRPPFCKDRGCLVDWAREYLENPEERGKLVDPDLKNVKPDDLSIICSVVNLCLEREPFKRPSMQIITAMLEDGIDTSATALLKESPLVWAELALSS
ncbi:probable LRR receptor-like serine/threonine-protein kinase At1g63430 [Phoenix dactylifera]|uniref:Probable LRR receptor-like serine/threonine-protein kinase At1g63430 n=1 Tax=Phoenix dactylifera TaxID=42345 RepID=A0A8B7D5S4_PHODC|nr:probable LRR receptor-like serine/threonine-protein kinase At1g63430 [Phoenix dactylifera]